MRHKFYGESATDELFERLKQAREVARFYNEDATLEAQKQYDKKAEPHKYQKDQLVLLSEHHFLNKNAKLAPKWTGPHKIVRLIGPTNVELKIHPTTKSSSLMSIV